MLVEEIFLTLTTRHSANPTRSVAINEVTDCSYLDSREKQVKVGAWSRRAAKLGLERTQEL
jgi:hypothetical protein